MPSSHSTIRLLAIDIDGTLVNSRDELTETTRQALHRACAAGLKIVLATGRRYSRALPLVGPLAIDAPLVTASGALIKHPLDHRTLFRATFERQLLCDLLTVVERRGFEAVLYADSYHDGFDFYCERLEVERAELADYLALNPGCHRLWPALMRDPPEGVFAGFSTGTRDEMLELHEELQRELPGLLYTHVLRSPRYIGHMCEIAPFGVTKWSGIQHVAAEWGILPEEMCAVGDDVNDIPMIEAAGIGIAMGNAQPEVKAAADLIAPTHDEDGLAAVVDFLLDGIVPYRGRGR
ncbi:MAG TPA: Cof-type HAD-IIB family hydrolase [Pirellulales bacterium]|nr:Cof-type HAD-IIB family hydrolase [Pirellulales bacterium]